jgi:hypothetical protein
VPSGCDPPAHFGPITQINVPTARAQQLGVFQYAAIERSFTAHCEIAEQHNCRLRKERTAI